MGSRKFGLGLIWQVGLKLLAVGLGFFTTRWLITILSSDAYETYNLIDAYNRAILMTITLGIPVLIQKYFTNQIDSEELGSFWSTMVVTRAISFLVGILLVIVSFPLSQINNLPVILGFFVAQFILLFDLNYRSVCDAKGHSWQFSLTDFLGKLVLVIILYAGIFLKLPGLDLNYFIFASIFAYLTGLIVDSVWQWRHTPWGKPDFRILKNNGGPLLFLTLSTFSVALYLNTDRLFLKFFGGDDLVINGYANAYKILDIASIVPGLTMPPVASFVKKRMDSGCTYRLGQEIQTLFQKANLQLQTRSAIVLEWTIMVTIVGILTTLVIFLFGPFIIRLLDPSLKYELALQALPILALSMVPMTPMLFFTNLIIFHGGEKYELLSTVAAAVVGTILYIVLISQIGLVGASLAKLGIYAFELAIKTYFLRRSLKKNAADTGPSRISAN
jgi:O-antigen/teichoic acid export membrane protein